MIFVQEVSTLSIFMSLLDQTSNRVKKLGAKFVGNHEIGWNCVEGTEHSESLIFLGKSRSRQATVHLRNADVLR